MIKIKAIDQQYTMEEITAIVDEIYPFGEYKLTKIGEPEATKMSFADKKGNILFSEDIIATPVYVEGRNFDFDYKKKALMGLFFTLNECNRIMAGQYITPLNSEECEEIVAKREKAYNQLQAIINPVKPQLPTIKGTQREIDAFQKAVDAGLMAQTATGYEWKRPKVQLAYFMYRVYFNEKIPYKAIQKLFGCRVDSALYALNNAKKPPEWERDIDLLI